MLRTHMISRFLAVPILVFSLAADAAGERSSTLTLLVPSRPATEPFLIEPEQATQLRTLLGLLREHSAEHLFRVVAIAHPDSQFLLRFIDSKYPFSDLKLEELPDRSIRVVTAYSEPRKDVRSIAGPLLEAMLVLPGSDYDPAHFAEKRPVPRDELYRPLQTFEILTAGAVALKPNGLGDSALQFTDEERRVLYVAYPITRQFRGSEDSYYALQLAEKLVELRNSSLPSGLQSSLAQFRVYEKSKQTIEAQAALAVQAPPEVVELNADLRQQRKILRSDFERLSAKIVGRSATPDEISQYIGLFRRIQEWVSAHEAETARIERYLEKAKSSEATVREFARNLKAARDARDKLVTVTQDFHASARKQFPEVYSQEWLDGRLRTMADDTSLASAEKRMAGARWEEHLQRAETLRIQLSSEIGMQHERNLLTAAFLDPVTRPLLLEKRSELAKAGVFYDRTENRIVYSATNAFGAAISAGGDAIEGASYNGESGLATLFVNDGSTFRYRPQSESFISATGYWYVPLYRGGDATQGEPLYFMIYKKSESRVSEYYIFSRPFLEKVRVELEHNEKVNSWKGTAGRAWVRTMDASAAIARPVWRGVSKAFDWTWKKIQDEESNVADKVDPYIDDRREAKSLDLEALQPVEESIRKYPEGVQATIKRILAQPSRKETQNGKRF
jgi:hypothetical protein